MSSNKKQVRVAVVGMGIGRPNGSALLSSLQEDFSQTGFAIVPNLFTRDEVQALKMESIGILKAVKEETSHVARHGVHVGTEHASA